MSDVNPRNAIPEDWGKDALTNFLDVAQENSYAMLHKEDITLKLREIAETYKFVGDNLNFFKGSPLVLSFIIMTQSCYLGAVRLALSGQIQETFILLRGCIERALYGYHIFKNPNLTEVWLNRDTDEEKKRECKSKFTYGQIIKTLETDEPKLGKTTDNLYNKSIDDGAHPNSRGYYLNTEVTKSDKIHDIFFIAPLTRAL